MKIIENQETCKQFCRNCNTNLEVEKSDMTWNYGWFHYKCIKCKITSEAHDVPSSYYSLCKETEEQEVEKK